MWARNVGLAHVNQSGQANSAVTPLTDDGYYADSTFIITNNLTQDFIRE